MATRDIKGRPYLKLSEAKPGQKIICDGGFTCVNAFETARLGDNNGRLFFLCKDGMHFIDGQAVDGEHCIGLYPTNEASDR